MIWYKQPKEDNSINHFNNSHPQDWTLAQCFMVLICSQFLFRASTPKEDCKILYTLTLHNRFWPNPAVRTSTLGGHGINNFEGFMVFLIMQSDSVEVMKMLNIKNINSIRLLLPSHRDKPLHLVIWNLQSWLRV